MNINKQPLQNDGRFIIEIRHLVHFHDLQMCIPLKTFLSDVVKMADGWWNIFV